MQAEGTGGERLPHVPGPFGPFPSARSAYESADPGHHDARHTMPVMSAATCHELGKKVVGAADEPSYVPQR